MIISGSLVKKLGKRPGKRIENAGAFSGITSSQRDGQLSGRLAPWLGATRLRTFEALHMPEGAIGPLRPGFCCFPHASPVSPSGAGKQKTVPMRYSKPRIFLREIGAGEGIRTLDPNLGKVVLYP
jgi:hypothetical protein